MARILVPLAEGFEEIELSTVVDVLRRGGVDVVVAGIDGSEPIRGSRGMVFVPDCGFADAQGPFDDVVLPGGMTNAERLAKHEPLLSMLRDRVKGKQFVSAICAAPKVLDAAGVLSPGGYTCYPGVQQKLSTPGRRNDLIVDNGVIATSQGPATAMRFALHLLARLQGEEVRNRVAQALLYPWVMSS